MKLNIYKNQREIIKTYECDRYRLMYGTIMDLTNIIDLQLVVDYLQGKEISDERFAENLIDLITNSMNLINGLLKDMFEGLTDEELKQTDINEIIQIVIEVASESVPLIKSGVAKKVKNLMGLA